MWLPSFLCLLHVNVLWILSTSDMSLFSNFVRSASFWSSFVLNFPTFKKEKFYSNDVLYKMCGKFSHFSRKSSEYMKKKCFIIYEKIFKRLRQFSTYVEFGLENERNLFFFWNYIFYSDVKNQSILKGKFFGKRCNKSTKWRQKIFEKRKKVIQLGLD